METVLSLSSLVQTYRYPCVCRLLGLHHEIFSGDRNETLNRSLEREVTERILYTVFRCLYTYATAIFVYRSSVGQNIAIVILYVL